jgi:hypothetical protein
MRMRSARWWSAAAALSAVALLVTACGPGNATDTHVSSAVVDHFRGAPHGVPLIGCGSTENQPCAAWADAHSLYVVTWGSGSCPLTPTSVSVANARKVVIRTVEHAFLKGTTACSDDLRESTSVVRLPATIDSSTSVRVVVDGYSMRVPAHQA